MELMTKEQISHREPVLCAYCHNKIKLIDTDDKGVYKLTCPVCGKATHVMVTSTHLVYTVKA